jgi:hypothetical protein
MNFSSVPPGMGMAPNQTLNMLRNLTNPATGRLQFGLTPGTPAAQQGLPQISAVPGLAQLLAQRNMPGVMQNTLPALPIQPERMNPLARDQGKPSPFAMVARPLPFQPGGPGANQIFPAVPTLYATQGPYNRSAGSLQGMSQPRQSTSAFARRALG